MKGKIWECRTQRRAGIRSTRTDRIDLASGGLHGSTRPARRVTRCGTRLGLNVAATHDDTAGSGPCEPFSEAWLRQPLLASNCNGGRCSSDLVTKSLSL